LVPRLVAAAMIAIAMSDAMRPYSMAVAPELSRAKRPIQFSTGESPKTYIATCTEELLRKGKTNREDWIYPSGAAGGASYEVDSVRARKFA
jgi:hypothetical protein